MALVVYLAWLLGCFWWLLEGGGFHFWWLPVAAVLLVIACFRSPPVSPAARLQWITWHRHHRHDC